MMIFIIHYAFICLVSETHRGSADELFGGWVGVPKLKVCAVVLQLALHGRQLVLQAVKTKNIPGFASNTGSSLLIILDANEVTQWTQYNIWV